MHAEHYIVVRDTTGAKVAEITDFWGLAYSRRVNDVGMAVVELQDDTPLIDLLGFDYQFEIMRHHHELEIDWYADFYGLLRCIDRAHVDGKPTYIATLLEQQSLLDRRIIAYPAGTNHRSEWTNVAAETVMKEIVTYNMTSAGTTVDGRKRDAALSGFTITNATDQARGNTISIGASWVNVLTALQNVAHVAGGDFALSKTGAATWEFEFYPGQLGTDRTATVIFSLTFGNMNNPQFMCERIDEKTVAIVGGQGTGANRATAIRTGPNHSTSNDIEFFVDARDLQSGLNERGDAELEERRADESLNFDVLQTPASFYGKHYFLGDLVTEKFKGVSRTRKVGAIHVTSSPNEGKQVEVELIAP